MKTAAPSLGIVRGSVFSPPKIFKVCFVFVVYICVDGLAKVLVPKSGRGLYASETKLTVHYQRCDPCFPNTLFKL